MRLEHGIHLGYCTNIHRGESWEETWRGLKEHTLRVKERVSGGQPYGIGLRLSAQAAQELSAPGKIDVSLLKPCGVTRTCAPPSTV